MTKMMDVFVRYAEPKPRKAKGKTKAGRKQPTRQGQSVALRMVQRLYPAVERVVDADNDVVIEVTKRDSQSKAVKNHTACALAVACQRELELDGVIISKCSGYLVKGTEAVRYRMKATTTTEVVSFDRGAGFEPGTYVLKAPVGNNKLGNLHGKPPAQRTENTDGNLLKRFRHLTTDSRSNLNSRDVV